MMRAVLTSTILAALPLSGLAASELPGSLVEPSWLARHLDRDNLVVLDIRNDEEAGGTAEGFAEAHIPGSVYSAYGEAGWRTTVGGVPGMTPPVEDLEELIGGLGIEPDDQVVIVHDGSGASNFGSAARVHWTFRYLGHDEVAILDGGWKAWSEGDYPVASGASAPEPATYEASVDDSLLIETEEVLADLENDAVVRIDARPEAQHRGEDKHPAAREAGRIPSSIGLEQALFVDPVSGRLRDRDELRAHVPDAVASGEADLIVSYCNTGHWAATNWFVLSQVLGYEEVALYDSSMCGWAADPDNPLESGPGAYDTQGAWTQRG